MATLHGTKDHPFLVAVETTPGIDVDVQVTLPDGNPGDLLDLVDDGGIHQASWTPTQVGTHTLTIVSPGNPVDALAVDLEISAFELPGQTGTMPGAAGCPTVAGKQLCWPAPRLAGLQCITQWELHQIVYWTQVATQTLFGDTAGRFPGCCLYDRLRLPISATCLCRVGDSWGYDLWPDVRWPVLELVDVTIDGVADDLTNWSIEDHRYLVPGADVEWPSQDWSASDGDVGAWSILIRYGRAPDPLTIIARDRFMYSMLIDNEPTKAGTMVCRLPDGTVSLSENGRTIQIDDQLASSTMLAEAKQRWGRRRWDQSQIIDPARPHARHVPGDHTPAAVRSFAPSGVDLQAILDDMTAPSS